LLIRARALSEPEVCVAATRAWSSLPRRASFDALWADAPAGLTWRQKASTAPTLPSVMGVTGAAAPASDAVPRPAQRPIIPRVFIDTTCCCYEVKCRTAYPRMVPSPRARYRFLFLVLQRSSQFHPKFA